MSESAATTKPVLRKAASSAPVAMPPRETLLQLRQGLLLQLRAIEKILWPDGKPIATKGETA